MFHQVCKTLVGSQIKTEMLTELAGNKNIYLITDFYLFIFLK